MKVEEKIPVGDEAGNGSANSTPLIAAPAPLEDRIERAKELLEKKKEDKRKQEERVLLKFLS